MSEQKEYPIIFSGAMVRAILAGKKTQTRRVVKPQPDEVMPPKKGMFPGAYRFIPGDVDKPNYGSFKPIQCPFGVPGDRLWVREGWRCTGGGSLRNIIYRVDGDTAMSFCGVDDGRVGCLRTPQAHWDEWDRLVYKTKRGCEWRPSIHMPRWAARIFVEVVNVQVERVQDASPWDIIAEGCPIHYDDEEGSAISEWWMDLWDSINAKRGYGWEVNPWVWVVEFKVVIG